MQMRPSFSIWHLDPRVLESAYRGGGERGEAEETRRRRRTRWEGGGGRGEEEEGEKEEEDEDAPRGTATVA
eukprot:2464644-Pyramimonas_sp.AAC.1